MRIPVMRKSDACDGLLRDHMQPFELTGTGEVIDGQVHLHVSPAGGDLVVAGHPHAASGAELFVHGYVSPLTPHP